MPLCANTVTGDRSPSTSADPLALSQRPPGHPLRWTGAFRVGVEVALGLAGEASLMIPAAEAVERLTELSRAGSDGRLRTSRHWGQRNQRGQSERSRCPTAPTSLPTCCPSLRRRRAW